LTSRTLAGILADQVVGHWARRRWVDRWRQRRGRRLGRCAVFGHERVPDRHRHPLSPSTTDSVSRPIPRRGLGAGRCRRLLAIGAEAAQAAWPRAVASQTGRGRRGLELLFRWRRLERDRLLLHSVDLDGGRVTALVWAGGESRTRSGPSVACTTSAAIAPRGSHEHATRGGHAVGHCLLLPVWSLRAVGAAAGTVPRQRGHGRTRLVGPGASR